MQILHAFRIQAAALGALALLAGHASTAQELTSATVESWLARYERAWEARDAGLAADLFSENASYTEMPLAPPMVGRAAIRDYWTTVTADQREIEFESQVLAVDGNTGVAHWHAEFKLESSGARVTLDGVFVLTFDSSGRCESLREWWHAGGE
jgi:ketosteroid isomerase-like protein